MKRYEKVKNNLIFNKIIKEGNKINSSSFSIYFMEKKEYNPNFGIAVGKKLGNAVIRNKLKRIYTRLIDQNKNLFQNNQDYIIIVKGTSLNKSFFEIEKELIYTLKEKKDDK